MKDVMYKIIAQFTSCLFLVLMLSGCNGASGSTNNTTGGTSNDAPYYLGSLDGGNGATIWSSSGSFILSDNQSTTGIITVINGGYNLSGFMNMVVVPDSGQDSSRELPAISYTDSICNLGVGSSYTCEYVISSSESVINGNYSIMPTFVLTGASGSTNQKLNSIGLIIANGVDPNPGSLVIIPEVESLIPNESTTAIVALSGSIGVFESINVTIASINPSALTITPESCSLTTNNNSCQVTMTGIAPGSANVTVSSNGYPTTQTTIAVTKPTSYVYVANSDSTISMYAINPNNGVLIPLIPSTIGSSPLSQRIRSDPTGSYVYANNYNGNTISMYAISPDNGRLTPLTPPSVVTDNQPNYITIDSTGRYFYVITNIVGSPTVTISMYSLALNTGLLSPLTPSTVPAGHNMTDLIASPNRGYIYALNIAPNPSVLMYGIESSTGLLIPLSPESTVSTGANPAGIAISPNGNYAYVNNSDDDTISSYSIGDNGVLAPFGAPIATGATPIGIIIEPQGKYLYTANYGENKISMYSIESSTGMLTQLSSPDVRTDRSPVSIIVDPTGQYVYVTNFSGYNISMYKINQNTGVLTQLIPATIPTGIAPVGITVATPK